MIMTKESSSFKYITTTLLVLLFLGIAVWTVSADPTGLMKCYVSDASTGNALGGATVTVASSDPTIAPITSITDNTGYCYIQVAPGTYTVTATDTGYNPLSQNVKVTAGAPNNPTASPNFALTPTSITSGVIFGTVADTYTGKGIIAATVTVSPGGMTAITDDSGSYRIQTSPGTYTVKASATGYTDGSTTTTVSIGTSTNTPLKLTPVSTPLGTISGTVSDAYTNQPIGGATVTVSPGGLSSITGNDGIYNIQVNAGTYTVTASNTGYTTASQTITVAAGLSAGPSFQLIPTPVVETPSTGETPSQAPNLGVPSDTSATTPSTTQTSQNPIEKSIEKKIVDSIPGFDISIAVAVLILLFVGLRIKKER